MGKKVIITEYQFHELVKNELIEQIDSCFITYGGFHDMPVPKIERIVGAFNKIKNMLNESSLTRLKQWLDTRDIATISAWRNKLVFATDNVPRPTLKRVKNKTAAGGYKLVPIQCDGETEHYYTTEEKKQRNAMMKAFLLSKGYGVIAIKGVYPESNTDENGNATLDLSKPGDIEDSFFVINLKYDPGFYDNLFRLSEYYNQDCFLYKSRNSKDAFLVGTNLSDFPGYKKRYNVGNFFDKVISTNMSRLGSNGFAFSSDPSELQPDVPQTFPVRKEARRKKYYDALLKKQAEQYSKTENSSEGINESLPVFFDGNMETLYSYGLNARRIINETASKLNKVIYN